MNIIFSILVERPPWKERVDVSICHWNTLAFKEILRGLSAEVKFQLFFWFFFPLLQHLKRIKLWTKKRQQKNSPQLKNQLQDARGLIWNTDAVPENEWKRQRAAIYSAGMAPSVLLWFSPQHILKRNAQLGKKTKQQNKKPTNPTHKLFSLFIIAPPADGSTVCIMSLNTLTPNN